MGYSIIKWFGTIIIIAVGLYLAISHTYKWKVSEHTDYNLSLPEYSFLLKDGRQARLTMSFVFNTKQIAQDVSANRLELIDLLNNILKDVDSTSFSSDTEIESLKTRMLMELKKAKYPVQYISFDTHPTLL